MIRLTALAIVVATVSTIAAYKFDANAVEHPPTSVPPHLRPPQVSGPNCRTEIGGKIVQLQLGQGIETPDGWRNCQTYDGHSLIIYSNKPSQSADIHSDG